MALLKDLPGRLNFMWYPRNDHPVVGTWPESVEGRTFEVRIEDVDDAITVDVDGTTTSFTVPAIDQDALTQDWTFVETTADPDGTVRAGGRIFWDLGYQDSDGVDDFTVSVTVDTAEVVFGYSAEIAIEASTRASADLALGAALVAHAADTTAIHGIPNTALLETVAGAQAKVDAAVVAVKGAATTSGDTLGELETRLAVVEALGSLATDAELVAAVVALIGTADTAGDTLGELQALIGARLLKSANLSDLPNASTALTNLGVSAFAKTILDDADAAAVRGTIGAQQAGTSVLLSAFTQEGGVLVGTGVGTFEELPLIIDGGSATSVYTGLTFDGGTA